MNVSPTTFVVVQMLRDLGDAGLAMRPADVVNSWPMKRKLRYLESIVDSLWNRPQTISALVRHALLALEHDRPVVFKQPRTVQALAALLVDEIGIPEPIAYARLLDFVEESVWYRMGKAD